MDNSFKKENELLEKAIHFATERHSGAVRKGKTIPYILHPLETLQILASMRADANLMIAGVLHDTVEDTDTTLEEIIELFGEDVGALVKSNSEDKSKSWEERKAHTIEYLKNAPRREKMLIMADKLANIRSLARDYLEVGDRLWERFNAPKEKQAWYYSGVQDSLFDMQSYDETSAAYWEFVAAFKDVFVGFFCDFDRERLYQICADGTGFYLQKGEPNWREIDHEISEDVVPLPRYKAESIEELWEMISESEGEDDGEYMPKGGTAVEDRSFTIYSSSRYHLSVSLSKGKFTLEGQEFGGPFGDEDEFFYSLNEEDTAKLVSRLMTEKDDEKAFSETVKNKFGKRDGVLRFLDFCEEIGVKPKFFSC